MYIKATRTMGLKSMTLLQPSTQQHVLMSPEKLPWLNTTKMKEDVLKMTGLVASTSLSEEVKSEMEVLSAAINFGLLCI